MVETGQREFGCARAAADRLLRFHHQNGPAGLCDGDGSGQAVRPRTDDYSIVTAAGERHSLLDYAGVISVSQDGEFRSV